MLPKIKNPYKQCVYKGFCEGRRIRTFDRLLRRQVLYPAELCLHCSCKKKQSGWQDSNLRPPAPKAGAITELRYTPKKKKIIKAEGQGLEPWPRLLDDSLANCSITTLAPLQAQRNVSCFAVANLRQLYVSHNYLRPFFLYFLSFLQNHFTIKYIEYKNI